MKEKVFNIIKTYGIIVVFIIILVIFSLASPVFFTVSNILNVVRQVSVNGIIAVGMTLVIVSGGLDLSVGAQVTFFNVFTAYLMVEQSIPAVLAVMIGILLCVLNGLIIGVSVTKFHIPPMIASLAMMTIMKGLAFIISEGQPISGLPKNFNIIGQGYVFGIPIPAICFISIVILGAIILNKTYFGRFFFAVGGNEEAAELSGINVDFIKILTYMLCGLLTGFAAYIMLSRVNLGSPNTGTGLEFTVITAVTLGGVSVSGGRASLLGVVAGVLILGCLNNGFILLNIDEYVQEVVQGIVLLVAVGFDCTQRYNSNRVKRTN